MIYVNTHVVLEDRTPPPDMRIDEQSGYLTWNSDQRVTFSASQPEQFQAVSDAFAAIAAAMRNKAREVAA